MRKFYQEVKFLQPDAIFIRVIDDDEDFPPEVVIVLALGEELSQRDVTNISSLHQWFDRVHCYLDQVISSGHRVASGYYM